MNRVTSIAVKFLFVLAFAVPAFGQATTPAAPFAPAKVALIDTRFFYADKEGITKLTAADASVEKEFEPRFKELQTMGSRLETLTKEIQALNAQLAQAAQNPKSPIDVNAIQASIVSKQEEGSRLEVDGKRKREDLENAYKRRSAAVMGPITGEISKALVEYSRSKGYGLVLDISKMVENGQIMYADETADITDEFIKYFNTKPATAAVPAKPATGAARP